MEGLLIAEQLRLLAGRLPAERLPWRFPDGRTASLPLVGDLTLQLVSRPPAPYLRVQAGAPEGSRPHTPFQEQLRARAGGALLAVTQPQRDRVVRLAFAAGAGFVPTPPVELVAELTGRNANLILLDERGVIIGVERQVLADRNRYRELRSGLAYQPPPPYSKLDPLGASPRELHEALGGARLSGVGRVLDGVGPTLAGALQRAVMAHPAASALADDDPVLEGGLLTAAVDLVQALAAAPSAFLARHGGQAPERSASDHRREVRLKLVGGELGRRQKLAERRLADARRAVTGAADGVRLRSEADLLLAFAHEVTPGSEEVELTGFDGATVSLSLDPRLDAAGNAAARYDQARRREARARRAEEQLPALEAEARDLARRLQQLPELPAAELGRLAEELTAERRTEKRVQSGPGIRFTGPHGFEVVVGRNARDNDKVTFELGRSRDVWLHAQGYRGSHVLIRSGGQEVPFETVLFAARLAAGYSEAFRSDNVPVDYTVRKNVWKVRGGPPGAVNFTQHRTVYVTPARDDAGALAGDG